MRMKKMTVREKAILAGLYLSKFDEEGLACLGFTSFRQAFNAIGLALNGKPASVKNYRDEFDPVFSNPRKGWRNRAMREHCRDIYERYDHMELADFSNLLRRAILGHGISSLEIPVIPENMGKTDTSFAKRLITGQAAERYFQSCYREIEIFTGMKIEDTTMLGCGFDFHLYSPNLSYGVEVKGISGPSGKISLTNKEHSVAAQWGSRYFLFVAKNFQETPTYDLFQDPLGGELQFGRVERKIVEISWSTKV